MSPLAIHALLEFQVLAYPNVDGLYATNAEAIRQLRRAGMIEVIPPKTAGLVEYRITKFGVEYFDQIRNIVPGERGVEYIAEVTVEAEINLDSYPIGTPNDIIARSQMDETIQRMSRAFAEKVSEMEGKIRFLEFENGTQEAKFERICKSNRNFKKRLDAARDVIRSLRHQLHTIRRACGIRPPKPRRFR